MRVQIRLFAALRERAGRGTLELTDVPVGSTIADLKRLAAEAEPRLGDLGPVAGVIGTTYASPETVVMEGAEVAFLPPVSGGAPSSGGTSEQGDSLESGIFELRADALDVAAIQARVSHPSCGAIVLFTGVTRETNRGQDVVELDYEAFTEMTGPEMGRIFADCLEAFGPEGNQGADRLRMLVVHRVGVVGVGEPSVAIAVASPHRDAAFRAARFLIDTLKERLPVWKKEVYGDGHHWIGDRS
ncbi:Molybdopterin synthase catalytic subunit 1 [Planctomycetes bacterium Poly30]|uniref:Molybdopterin synthase catalytic subunit n=1 Tax=Saltatorellus ferox TaxID=2528018 RepID=A0A518ESH2_9BACT|nr:Molybdopterin synthase catalytic subunit 1 [Planctomycetes bacterium Poly30]